MCRWRKRIGDVGAEQLLKETIEAGLKLKAIKTFQLKRINVDTTVQEKEIRFPIDARLYGGARQRLVDAAKKRRLSLRQNYNRKAKQLLAEQNRYAHARRDIERKYPESDNELKHRLDISTGSTNSNARIRTKFIVFTHRRLNASARERPTSTMSSAAKSL